MDDRGVRTRLRALRANIAAAADAALGPARAGLEQKRKRLDQFTVVLFGRTMAGKSTLREALTDGDGSSIGKGAQRTTRDVREYQWNALRILDTPGIGAYAGEEDRALAISVIDEADVVLFLASSDGIQEESSKGMRDLRNRNKRMLVVLNVKRDLQKPVFLRRFLADRTYIFDDIELRGHIARIRWLASKFLEMEDVPIFPIHAQAAYLSTRPEHCAHAHALADSSGIHGLLKALEEEVRTRGTVRRLQTVLDGTIIPLVDLQAKLKLHAEAIEGAAVHMKEKSAELDTWLDAFARTRASNIEAAVAALLGPLRASVSAFVDDNIEHADVRDRWQRKVKGVGIDTWLKRQQATILDDFQAGLSEFAREVAVEEALRFDLGKNGPETVDPWDVQRTLRWTSAGAAAVGSIAVVAAMVGAANIWNPVGWAAGAVSVVALGISWFFSDREETLQREKAVASARLREEVGFLETRLSEALKDWLYANVRGRIGRDILSAASESFSSMFQAARALDDAALQVAREIEHLNRRLLARTGQLLGFSIVEENLGRVVRHPGVQSKFLWRTGRSDCRFSEQVGLALNERVDGVEDGPLARVISDALRPASVHPSWVELSGRAAAVRVPPSQVERAAGKSGSNLALASRLVGLSVEIIEETVNP